MPFDFPSTVHPRLLNRLARAGALNDPAACSQWLPDRVDRDQRREIMSELFPVGVGGV